MAQKEEAMYFAKLSEQAERYDDMVKNLKVVTSCGDELNSEERSTLSIGYKNYIGLRRNAWRALIAFEQKEEAKGSKSLPILRKYKDKIVKEVSTICSEIVELLKSTLIPKAKSPECKVFYYKMKGDYLRYNAECSTGEDKIILANRAIHSYGTALREAKVLPTTSPLKLGVALNYSVLYYEILGSPEDAMDVAKTTFEEAISDLEGLDSEAYKDSATILQLMKDNLTLWNSELEGSKKVEEEKD